MSYKTILAPMMFEETARVVAEAAITIAGAERGHVIGKHIRQKHYYYPPTAYGVMSTSYPRGFDQALSEAARSFAEAQKSLFEEICDDAGVHRIAMQDAPRKRGITASWSEEQGIVPDGFGRAARVADLSIAGVPGKKGGSREVDLIETLLVSSGKPVLLVPKTGLAAYPENILICWDGSRSAARAIDAARPFLKAAKSVRILTLKEIDYDAPGLEDAVAHLGMHGVKAIPDFIAKPKGGLAKRILNEANNAGADLIVMGGYSHRRFNEAIFGGVTRYMLDHGDRALLMAH
jgi:nucleotide-binding universal stress UspA family protein